MYGKVRITKILSFLIMKNKKPKTTVKSLVQKRKKAEVLYHHRHLLSIFRLSRISRWERIKHPGRMKITMEVQDGLKNLANLHLLATKVNMVKIPLAFLLVAFKHNE